MVKPVSPSGLLISNSLRPAHYISYMVLCTQMPETIEDSITIQSESKNDINKDLITINTMDTFGRKRTYTHAIAFFEDREILPRVTFAPLASLTSE